MINDQYYRDYLIIKGFDFQEKRRESGLYAIMLCPFCQGGPKHEKCFAINLEHGGYKCNRLNHCGVSGSFNQFKQYLGDRPKMELFSDISRQD